MRIRAIVSFGILLNSVSAFAYSDSFETLSAEIAFQKRFEIRKNLDGKAEMIIVRSLKPGNGASLNEGSSNGLGALAMASDELSIDPVLESVREELLEAQSSSSIAGGGLTNAVMPGLEEWPERYRNLAQKSLEQAKNVDVEQAFKDSRFRDVVRKFENKLKQHAIGFRVVANLNDTRYFYSRAAMSQIVDWGLKYARKNMAGSPFAQLAIAVIKRIGGSIEHRRSFHQYMLLHYLEQVSPQALGLTAQEISYIRSSIFESRIKWYAVWESNTARADWAEYGDAKFEFVKHSCNSMVRAQKTRYSSMGARMNFAFFEVTEDGKRKIINLKDKKHVFSALPSNAYFFDNPKAVKQQRLLIQLVELGVGYVPVPSFIKSNFTDFLSSMYEPQSRTEGALLAHFESQGQSGLASEVVAQTNNPYLMGE